MQLTRGTTEMGRTQEDLGKEVVRVLRALANVGDDREKRTVLLRQLATAGVDLRAHFLTPESVPDWAGRTWAYREYLRDLYRKAGYTAEETASTQAAARYHAGNIVRARLSDTDLQDLGLQESSPAARARSFRGARSATLKAVRDEGADRDADPLSRLAVTLMHLQAITGDDFAGLTEEEMRLAHATIDGVEARVRGLRRELRGEARGGDSSPM